MNRDDIIRMAREVGMQGMLTDVVTTLDEIERFAHLVAASEREACAQETQTVAWPEGYEIHELPADYTGRVWIEGQIKRLFDYFYGENCVGEDIPKCAADKTLLKQALEALEYAADNIYPQESDIPDECPCPICEAIEAIQTRLRKTNEPR